MIRTEIITVGREILDGRVVDTNSTHLGFILNQYGLCPRFAQRVDDHIDRIKETFKIAESRADVVVVSGGLGPTSDDLTLEAFGKYSGKELRLNESALAQVKNRFEKMNRPFTELQKKQAIIPEGSTPLENLWGTAPGVFVEHKNVKWFFLPGVPTELKGLFENSVLPLLRQNSVQPQSWTWLTQFTSEGELQDRLKDVIKKCEKENFEVTFRTKFPENHIGLCALDLNPTQKILFENYKNEITTLLGKDYFSEGVYPTNLENVFFERAKDLNTEIVFAESCTGGLLAHRITKIPGASSHFWGSFTVYDNSAKENLGVNKDTLDKFGAVSAECAQELALSALNTKLRIKQTPTLSLSTTGIAGPSGGSTEKPVGLCYSSAVICDQSGKIIKSDTEKIMGRKNLSREENILFFSQKALSLGLKLLKS